MRRVKVAESEIGKLGSEAAMRAHFSDELRVNELFAFIEQADELAAGWSAQSQAAKTRFFDERPRVIREGDRLAALAAEGLSALVRKDYVDAQAGWKKARAKLLELR